MVKRLSLGPFPLRQVVGNVLLEVCEPSIRYKDICERPVALLANAQEFDLPGLIRQALECQCDIRLTDELNLQAQPAFQLQFPLDAHCRRGHWLQILDLPLQEGTMPPPGLDRDVLLRHGRRLRREFDCSRCISKDEVRAFSFRLIRHGSAQSSCCSF